MNRPFLFIYELTRRCNQQCLYCYNVWHENSGGYPDRELTLNEIQALFERLTRDVKVSYVVLTGGEPLLDTRLFDVIKILKRLQLKVSVATNGTLFSREHLQSFLDLGVDYLELSLDSVDRDIYHKMTGTDLLPAVLDTIRSLRFSGIRVAASCVLTPLTISGLPELIEFCARNGLCRLSLNRFVPGGRGLRAMPDLFLDDAHLTRALRLADTCCRDKYLPVAVTVPVEDCLIRHDMFPNLIFGACSCGRKKWVIDPGGYLRLCEQHPEILGDLLSESFRDLSAGADAKDFRADNLSEECSTCRKILSCGGGCRILHENALIYQAQRLKSGETGEHLLR